jgi:hypothetical protein
MLLYVMTTSPRQMIVLLLPITNTCLHTPLFLPPFFPSFFVPFNFHLYLPFCLVITSFLFVPQSPSLFLFLFSFIYLFSFLSFYCQFYLQCWYHLFSRLKSSSHYQTNQSLKTETSHSAMFSHTQMTPRPLLTVKLRVLECNRVLVLQLCLPATGL